MKKVAFILISLFFLANLNGQAQDSKKYAKAIIKTSAHCHSCKEKIEKALVFEKGVKDAVLDMKSKIVTVTYKIKQTDPEKLKQALVKAGYTAEIVKKTCTDTQTNCQSSCGSKNKTKAKQKSCCGSKK